MQSSKFVTRQGTAATKNPGPIGRPREEAGAEEDRIPSHKPYIKLCRGDEGGRRKGGERAKAMMRGMYIIKWGFQIVLGDDGDVCVGRGFV